MLTAPAAVLERFEGPAYNGYYLPPIPHLLRMYSLLNTFRTCFAPFILMMIVVGMHAAADQARAELPREQVDFFEAKVRPQLIKQCYSCHSASANELEGGLRLDSRDLLRKGGDSGDLIVPGNPQRSLLMQALRYGEDSFQMPPSGKLPANVIADFETWIKMGAPDPRDKPSTESPSAELAKQHWAFQPPRLMAVPVTQNTSWPRSKLDSLVLARMEKTGLQPSPSADREALVRRLYYDLIGLPPTFDQVQQFRHDDSPDAVQRLIDQLIHSHHFGERWGRHWLDVARYADTKGYVFREDRNYAEAYKYRDWVARAFNEDLPYDRFLMLQLAADRLVDAGDADQLAAMGFLTLGRRFLNNTHDIIDDRIDVVTRGLMALTVNCARCHDHKFDPIPTLDYYSLYGVFHSSHEPKDRPSPLQLVDKPRPGNIRVFLRGSPASRGDIAPRRFLTALAGDHSKPFQNGSGRLELAREIVRGDNPLTARVFVNRVWQHLFGAALVNTPSDFGVRSDPPTQPEALDQLAVQFAGHDSWSMKRLIRAIASSSVYCQSSLDRTEPLAIDPENQRLWKMNRRRRDFEGLRDALLAVSGQLQSSFGGASVDIVKPPYSARRTFYGFIDRQNLPGLFRSFDFASPDTHAPKRYETTVPQQALFLLNSGFALKQARHLVNRLPADARADERVRELYRIVLARDALPEEIELGSRFVKAAGQINDQTWQYGHGGLDDQQSRVVNFRRLPHWTGQAWQGGPQLPDAKLGWVLLRAESGHPGNQDHAAIRRWVAPRDGVVSITGDLKHPSDQGDGVRALVITDRQGRQGNWHVRNSATQTGVASIKVAAGEYIDFVTHCGANQNHDSFSWQVRIRYSSSPGNGRGEWNSETDFNDSAQPTLTPWQRLAQVLLLSNEFIFID